MLDETTIPELPPLLIPLGGNAQEQRWRAWTGYAHLIAEQAERATRDAAIRALLELLDAQEGEAQWVSVEQLGASASVQQLLVRVVSAACWSFDVLEVA